MPPHLNATIPAQNGPIILMYHSIDPRNGKPKWPWAVSLAKFKAQLDLLDRLDYHTMTIAELVTTDVLPPRTIVITFDDGYKNNLPAYEALQEKAMCATWFVVSGAVGQKPGWPLPDLENKDILNSEDLRRMDAAGMEIGSHSVNHRRLRELDNEQMIAETRESKKVLEDILGHSITSFAYPYGEHSLSYEAEVAAAGYTAACTVDSGWATLDSHTLRLRRISVFNNDSCATLQRKLTFASNDVGLRFLATYYRTRLVNRLLPNDD